MLGPRVVDHGLFRVWSDCYPSRDQWCESVGSDALRGLARREDVWLAADLDVGAEGVEPGDLSAVTATLLGAFGGIDRIPTPGPRLRKQLLWLQHSGAPPAIDGESPRCQR